MSLDLAAMKQDFQRLQSKPGGNNNFMEKLVQLPENEGSTVIRLLPPREGQKLPYLCSRTHRINNKTIHSPMTLVSGKWFGVCDINLYYQSLWNKSRSVSKEESDALQAEARSIKPVERFYWNCIQRQRTTKAGVVETNVGPLIFPCGKQIHHKIMIAMFGSEEFDEPALGDITDIETGRDFKIIKKIVASGPNNFPNYNESKFLNPSVAGTPAEVKRWMASLNDLESLRIIKPREEILKELNIHRGLEVAETNTQYSYDVEMLPKAPTRTTVSVPDGVPSVNAKSAKTVILDEDDAMLETDFLNQIRA